MNFRASPSMHHKLLAALLIATCLVSPSGAMAAACTNTIIGSVADCTLNNGQNVTVASGGSVTSGGAVEAIGVNSGVTAGNITNNGQITSSSSNGIHVHTGSTAGTLQNTGTINANITGIYARGNVTSMTNSGTIDATVNNGMHLSGAAMTGDMLNDTGGTINALGNTPGNSNGLYLSNGATVGGNVINRGDLLGYAGVRIDNSTVAGTVSNSGTIDVDQQGIKLINGATIDSFVNTADGYIISNADAFDSDNGTITNGIVNHGMIQGTGSAIRLYNNSKILSGGIITDGTLTGNRGIDLQGAGVGTPVTVTGDVVNNGDISANTAGISLRDYASIIGNITNSGSIDAGSGTAIAVLNHSSVNGAINNTGTMHGDTGIKLLSSTVDSIGNATGATITSSGHGLDSDDSIIANGIVNDGTINAVASGLRLFKSTINANGINLQSNSILNTGYGIDLQGGSNPGEETTVAGDISNAGRITATDVGISLRDTSSVTGNILNSGTIDASTSGKGISLENGSSITGDIRNSGMIDGAYAGINLDTDIHIGGVIFNSGTIQSTYGAGIYGDGATIDGIIHNATGGLITTSDPGSDAILIQGNSIVGGVTNDGTISSAHHGVHFNTGTTVAGDFVNGATGIINTQDQAVVVEGATIGNILNNGSIVSANGSNALNYGIEVKDGSTVSGTITNNKTISGSDIGLRVADSTVTGGIINNAGASISGGTYAVTIESPTAPLTFTNYGVLNGALRIDNTTLNLEDGSVAASEIGGTGGIVNINTNLTTTASQYGITDGALQEINVAAGKTFTAQTNGFTFATADFNNNGTFLITGNPSASVTGTVDGNYTQAAGGILGIDAQLPSVHSALNVTGTGNFAAGTGIDVNITGNQFDFANGARINNVVTAGTLNASTFNVTDNSYLYNFTSIINGNAVDLQSVVDNTHSVLGAVNTVQPNSPATGAAGALNQVIAQGPTGDMGNVINALASLSTDQQVSDAVRQTLPTLTGGTTTALLQTLDTTNQIIQARQAQNAGLSSGDNYTAGKNLWFKPFGTWSNQQDHNGVTGYDANTYGGVGGVDGTLSNDWRVGMALAYANTNVKSNDALNKVGVDTYQASLYSSYALAPKTEANFQLDGGFNRNDSTRILNFGGLDRNAKGDFDGYSLHARAGVGHVLDLGKTTSLMPSARLDYSVIHNQSYTETDAGALNLNVDSQTTEQLIPSLAMKLNHQLDKTLSLNANAGVGYNLLNDRNSITASFVGGGDAFVTEGIEPSPWIVRSGLGLTYAPSDAYDISLRYDREDRGSRFDAQTASARLKVSF